MRLIRAISLATLLAFGAAPALSQWQTPNNSVPVGRGGGTSGFKSVGPCAAGEVLMGQGSGSPPVCSSAAITTVATLAALKALPGPFTNGQVIFIRGWAADDDGGQGNFIYNSSSALLADDGVVVTPTVNGSGNGRFIRDVTVTFDSATCSPTCPRHAGAVETPWFGDVSTRTDAQRQAVIQTATNYYTYVKLRPKHTYNLPTAVASSATVKAQIWIKYANQTLDCQGATLRRQTGDFSPGNPPTETRLIIYIQDSTAAAEAYIDNPNVVNCRLDGNNTNNSGIGTTTCCTFVQDNNLSMLYGRNYVFRDIVTSNAIGSGLTASASDGGTIDNVVGANNGKETVYLSSSGPSGIARRVFVNNVRSSGSNFNFGQSGGSYFSSTCLGGATRCTYAGMGFSSDNLVVNGYISIDDASGIAVTAVGSPLDNNVDFILSNFYIEQTIALGQQVYIGNALTTDRANFNKNVQVVNGTIKGPAAATGLPGFQLAGVRKANISNVTINGAGATGLYIDQTLGSQTATITGITAANPAVVTATAHGYLSGDKVVFSNTVGGMTQIRGLAGTVTFINANQFSVNIDASAFSAFTSGGTTSPIVLSRDINVSNTIIDGSVTNGVTLRSTIGVNLDGLIVKNSGGWGIQAFHDGSGVASNTSLLLGQNYFLTNASGNIDLTAATVTSSLSSGSLGGLVYFDTINSVKSTGSLSGLVVANGGTVPITYGGASCTNQFIAALNALGTATCVTVNLASHVTGTLPATNGGTGNASYAVGDILYASSTTALSRLADIATGNALISGGVNTAPSWGKIGLTTHVSGILPPANGGTGIANNAASTLTISGAFATTLTVTNTTGVTLPTTGTLATLAGTETFTNKYITRPVAQGGTVVPTTGSGAGGCGTGPAVSGTDTAGIVTLGTSPNATSCTITFSQAWNGAGGVVCAVQNSSTGTATYMSAASTTAFSVTGTFAAGHLISYMCWARP